MVELRASRLQRRVDTRVARTTCNRDCPDACGILADVERHPEGERVVRLRGDPAHPVTQGFLCYRTSHFLERQYAPERLTSPLLRKGGALVEVGWQEALDFAAARLLAIRAESGPSSIFHYRSGGSLGYVKHVVDLFFERFGPCARKSGDICNGAAEDAQLEDFGDHESNDLFDLENARSIVLWGKNVYTSSPHTIPVLKRAKQRGATLTLIDPVHHKTARLCDRYIQSRPGGDLSLALAVSRLLVDEQRLHPDASSWCDGLDDWQRLVTRRSLHEHAALAGVTLDEVRHLADALTASAPCTILVGWGLGRRANGGTTVRAIDALGVVTGNIGAPGAGVSFYFGRRKGGDFSFGDSGSVAPRTIPEPLFGRALLEARDPPVRAVWITAANPVAMLPDSETNARALDETELVVVVDSWLSDTARHATLVLPTTTLLEEDDVLGAYGHHYVGVARPVVRPPEGARSDLEILQAIAARTGLAEVLHGDAREWQRRITAPKLAPAGLSLDDMEQGAVRSPACATIAFEGRRFATTNGKARLLGALDLRALADRHDEVLALDVNEWPLELMSTSTPDSQCSQWVREPDAPLEATLHPDAAAGVPNGALARLESPLSSLLVRVRYDDKQRLDLVRVPKGGSLAKGRCANVLVAGRLTDRGGGTAIYDQRVRLVPLDEGPAGDGETSDPER